MSASMHASGRRVSKAVRAVVAIAAAQISGNANAQRLRVGLEAAAVVVTDGSHVGRIPVGRNDATSVEVLPLTADARERAAFVTFTTRVAGQSTTTAVLARPSASGLDELWRGEFGTSSELSGTEARARLFDVDHDGRYEWLVYSLRRDGTAYHSEPPRAWHWTGSNFAPMSVDVRAIPPDAYAPNFADDLAAGAVAAALGVRSVYGAAQADLAVLGRAVSNVPTVRIGSDVACLVAVGRAEDHADAWPWVLAVVHLFDGAPRVLATISLEQAIHMGARPRPCDPTFRSRSERVSVEDLGADVTHRAIIVHWRRDASTRVGRVFAWDGRTIAALGSAPEVLERCGVVGATDLRIDAGSGAPTISVVPARTQREFDR